MMLVLALVVSGVTLASLPVGLGQTSNYTTISLCREIPGTNSTGFCRCKENVIDCDFSSFNTSEKHGIGIQGWNEEHNVNIKRLCFCGGPRHLHLFVKPNVFTGLRRLHRVDFYNFSGVIHLRNTMSKYFSGDIYMSRVKVNTIHTMEFGPSDPFVVEDVSGIQCCSKIPPAKNLSHPVLHVEDSQIGRIEENGIDDQHRWSNVIFHNVSLNSDRFGINLNTYGLNVSILSCKFRKTNATAITLRNAANVLVAGNSFSPQSHPVTFESLSDYPSSNLLFLENYFHNASFLLLDAKKVVAWFNHFQGWDSELFLHVNETRNPGRLFGVQFNTFKTWNPAKFTNANVPDKSIVFQENVLGPCGCSNNYTDVAKIFQESRCEIRNPKNVEQVCEPTIEDLKTKCGKSSEINYESFCNGETRLGASYRDYAQTLEHFFHLHNLTLDSPFVTYVLNNHANRFNYEVTPIGFDEPQSPSARKLRDDTLIANGGGTLTSILGAVHWMLLVFVGITLV